MIKKIITNITVVGVLTASLHGAYPEYNGIMPADNVKIRTGKTAYVCDAHREYLNLAWASYSCGTTGSFSYNYGNIKSVNGKRYNYKKHLKKVSSKSIIYNNKG